jgi:hypothetical protein
LPVDDDAAMRERFVFPDLREVTFFGVDLGRATFRDVDLSGARFSHALLVDVAVDGEIDRLVVNGVDVTQYVNERDEWFDLRSRVRFTGVDGAQAAWPRFVAAWEEGIERARRAAHLGQLDASGADAEVEVHENGTNAIGECIGVVFEEHIHHLRYALGDLE